MELYLIRHGNTFNPDDPVVWTGKSNDLPLVAKGLEQAQAGANWLAQHHVAPDACYCSYLSRTKRAGEIIISTLAPKLKVTSDERLDEIDYGSWTGRTDQEVIDMYGEAMLLDWRNHSTFPPNGIWNETEAEVQHRTSDFMQHILRSHSSTSTVILISSNGILRYLLKALSESHYLQLKQQEKLAVKTGAICHISLDPKQPKETIMLHGWNIKP